MCNACIEAATLTVRFATVYNLGCFFASEVPSVLSSAACVLMDCSWCTAQYTYWLIRIQYGVVGLFKGLCADGLLLVHSTVYLLAHFERGCWFVQGAAWE